jgi:CRP/FNR family transcriptional regulator
MDEPGQFIHIHPFTSTEKDFLEHKKKQLLYTKGENIFKQGAFAHHVIYVLSGLIKVYIQTGYNKQVNIRIARAGEFLAFSSVFGEDVYSYSTVTLKDSMICMIDKEGLRELLMKNNEFAMQINTRNFQVEKHLYNVIASMSFNQMRGKMASALLYLSSDEFINEGVFQHLTRQDIADFATISMESAIKFLKEFEKDKIITLSGKDIYILDRERLQDIAMKG